MSDSDSDQLKLDGVAQSIVDPHPAIFITMHSKLVRQDRNSCLGGTAYLQGSNKNWSGTGIFQNKLSVKVRY